MKKAIIAVVLMGLVIILESVVHLLRMNMSIGLNAACGCLVIFSLTVFSLKKYSTKFNPYQIAGFVLTGLLLFETILLITNANSVSVRLPVILIQISGIIGGYFFYYFKLLPLQVKLMLAAIILESLVSLLHYTGMRISSVGGFITFLVATSYFLKTYNSLLSQQKIIGYLLLGIMLLQIPIRVIDFTSTLISLPDFLVHILGIFAGYFFYERKKLLHIINLSVSVMIVLFVYFYGYDLWMNKVDYGNFSSNVYYKGPEHIDLKDKNQATVTIEKGKILVLDFWFIGCGPCMNGFPDLQKLYSTYKNNPKVQFYAVNQPFPISKDVNSFKILTGLGYTFPMVACPDRSLTSELQINAYPTIVVLDTNGYVIYKGGMDNLDAAIKSNL